MLLKPRIQMSSTREGAGSTKATELRAEMLGHACKLGREAGGEVSRKD